MHRHQKLRIARTLTLLLVVGCLTTPNSEAGIPLPSNYVFATYLGGSLVDDSRSVVVAPDGGIYVAGVTQRGDFPNARRSITLGPGGGPLDVFVAKLTPSGTALEFLTVIGGTGEERVGGATLDAQGDLLIAGTTNSVDFPIVNAPQPALAGGKDAFLLRLSADGSRLGFSTYFGGRGDDVATGVVAGLENGDTAGPALAGETKSRDFPATLGEIQPDNTFGGFVAGFTPDGERLRYAAILHASFLGGTQALTADAAGDTYSTGPFFITKLSAAGDRVLLDIPLDSAGDEQGRAIAVDADGFIHVAVMSDRRNEYFYETEVRKLTPDGTHVVYSLNVSREGAYQGRQSAMLAIDAAGNACLAMFEDASLEHYAGTLTRLDPGGRILTWVNVCDALQGVAVTPSGDVFVAGYNIFTDGFWPTRNALQASPNGGRDAFVARLAFDITSESAPTIDRVELRQRPRNPSKLRTVITGRDFQSGALVFVESPYPSSDFKVKSSTRIVSRFALQPQEPITVTVVNPDGGTATYVLEP